MEVEGKEVKRRNPLSHDVAELQSGRLIPDDLPIDIQCVDLDFSVEHPHRWRQRHRRVMSILVLGCATWIGREVTQNIEQRPLCKCGKHFNCKIFVSKI